jgi:hypothetical protein
MNLSVYSQHHAFADGKPRYSLRVQFGAAVFSVNKQEVVTCAFIMGRTYISAYILHAKMVTMQIAYRMKQLLDVNIYHPGAN